MGTGVTLFDIRPHRLGSLVPSRRVTFTEKLLKNGVLSKYLPFVRFGIIVANSLRDTCVGRHMVRARREDGFEHIHWGHAEIKCL